MSNVIHTDGPEVRAIVAQAFPEYKGRRYAVEVFQGPMRLDSYWSGGTRDYWAFVVLDRHDHGAVGHVPENGTPFRPPLGELKELPVGAALVCYTMGSFERMRVYVHADNMNRLALPAPACLTRDQKIVLAATRSYKNSYGGQKNVRFSEAASYTGITLEGWEQAKAECVALGFLNKAGAITDAGRNAIGSERVEYMGQKAGAQ